MSVSAPKIDKRDSEDVLKEIKTLVPFYTPEWDVTEDKGSGIGLLKIFSYLLETVINRQNMVPEKNFIAFLNTLGAKLLPAQSAKAPITFFLSEGTEETVSIPQRTQVAAGEVIFETEKNILATPSRLIKAYSIDVANDGIYESPANVVSGEPVVPFQTKLLYAAKKGDKEIFVSSSEGLNKGDHLMIGESEYAIVSAVSEARVTLSHKLEKNNYGVWFYHLPPKAIRGVGKIFGERLSKRGVNTVEKLLKFKDRVSDLAKILSGGAKTFEYYKEQAENILENTQKRIMDEEYENMTNKDVVTQGILPSMGFYHDANSIVKKVTCFEFFEGKNIQEHVLYLGHNDFFNIKGNAKITTKVPNSQNGLKLGDSSIIQWEYWGEEIRTEGTKEIKEVDWHPLNIVSPEDRNLQEIHLEKEISGEIKECEINGIKNRWIRCKTTNILKTKDIVLDNIQCNVEGVRFYKLPPKAIRGVGKVFGERLSKGGVNTVEELLKFKGKVGDLAKILSGEEKPFEYYKERSENILENAQKRIMDEEYENMANMDVITQGILPEMAFYNDVPLDIKNLSRQNPIHPFGKTPRLYDTFYIASQEAFSKKDAILTLTFTYEPGEPSSTNNIPNTPQLSWEYWNGKGWVVLTENFANETNAFSSDKQQSISKTVTFSCPDDTESTNVNGQENYWIRVRIAGGDYGKEIEIIEEDDNATVGKGTVNPPKITKLSINYSSQEVPLQHCLTYNNLEFKDVTKESKTEDKSFKPFEPLEDDHQALYLGFDKKLEKGPISIFFSLEEQPYSVDNIPDIDWEYYSEKGKWARLEMLDGTMNLTQSGTIEFIAPDDLAKCKRFGKDLYWIRAVDVENKFKPLTQSYVNYVESIGTIEAIEILHPRIIRNYLIPSLEYVNPSLKTKILSHISHFTLPPMSYSIAAMPNNLSIKNTTSLTNPHTSCSEEIKPCPSYFKVFPPQWSHPKEVLEHPPSPKVKGIYLNTTWAVQQETISDELLGSSDGTSNQEFAFTKTPVLSEEVWVNEINALSEEERKAIVEKNNRMVNPVKDEEGSIIEFWVKWQPLDDLLDADDKARVYQIDGTFGKIEFGDGTHGMIPPIGADNIKVNYTTGGGKKGNVGACEITDLKTSIAFVDKVSNPDKARGGADIEILETALERVPQSIKNRNRAVTVEDFEWIAKQASRDIARVNCIPNFNDEGKSQPGWVTVIVVPESKEIKPEPSPQIKHKIEEYIKMRCANVVSYYPDHIQVEGPIYVGVMMDATIFVKSIDSAPWVEDEAYERLKAFLHPLTGGYENKGWEFGRMPFLSDFFPILEGIEGVDYVESLSMMIKTKDKEEVITEDKPVEIKLPLYTLIFSGEHRITIKWRDK